MSLLVVVTLALGVGVFALATGAPLSVSLAQGGVIAAQAAIGMAWWGLARRGQVSVLELLGMGLAIGTIVSVLADVLVAGVFGVSRGWVAMGVVTLIAALVLRRRYALKITTDRREWMGFATSAGAGLALLLIAAIRSPLPGDRIPETAHPDLTFFESLARGLTAFGPSDSLLMSGSGLRYHWFAYSWAGSLEALSAAPVFQTLTRTLPLVALVAVTALAVSWSRRMSEVPWVPALAGLLIVGSTFVGARFGVLLNFDSPSQQFSLMWLLALTVAFLVLLRREAHPWSLVIVALLAAATTGGKVSTGLIGLLGIGAVAAVALIRRESWTRLSIAATVVAALASAATYWLLILGVDVAGNIGATLERKAAVFQGLIPVAGTTGIWIGTGLLALATLPRLAGLLPLGLNRTSRWQPETVFSLATVGAGLLALIALSEGVNDLWFILAASGPACVVAAVGVGSVAGHPITTQRGRDTRPWAVVGAVVAVLLLVVIARTAEPYMGVRVWAMPLLAIGAAVAIGTGLALLTQTGASRRAVAMALSIVALTTMGMAGRVFEFANSTGASPVLPVADIGVVAPPPPGRSDVGAAAESSEPEPTRAPTKDPADVARDGWTAAAWVAANTPLDAIVATDDPQSLDLTALSGRRAYLAGARYQIGLGDTAAAAQVPVREANSRALPAGPTEALLADLCSAGVGWLWLTDPQADTLWEGVGAVTAHRNESVTVLELGQGLCPAE